MEEIKIAAKPKTRAKAKARVKPQEQAPTHDPDEVPPQEPPSPSREKPQKHETPEELWHNTLRIMKGEKDKQYKRQHEGLSE